MYCIEHLIAAYTCARVCRSEDGSIAPPRFAAAALPACTVMHTLHLLLLLLTHSQQSPMPSVRLRICLSVFYSLRSASLWSAPHPSRHPSFSYLLHRAFTCSIHMCPCVSIRGWVHRPAAVRCCCTACIQSYAHSPPPPIALISLVAISHAFHLSPYLSFRFFLFSLLHLPLACSTSFSSSLI